MGQTWLDNDAHDILRATRKQMQDAGTKGATLGDAVRMLKRNSDELKKLKEEL